MEDTLFLAWAAGFFDGEGCVLVSERFSKSGGESSFQLYVTVTQQDTAALYEIQERFGGSVTPDKAALKGYGRKKGTFLVWRWKSTSIVAYNFLKAIEPYSIVKAPQIAIALKWPEPGADYRNGRRLPDGIRQKRNDIMYALRAARANIKERVDA
jgi:hypothetical protein